MLEDTNTIFPMTEENNNFSKATSFVEKEEKTLDEELLSVSYKFIEKNKQAYKVLAE